MSRDNLGPSALGSLVVGAIGGVIAVILLDARKRKQIMNTLNDWVDTGQEKFDDAREQIEETTNRSRRKLARKLDPDRE